VGSSTNNTDIHDITEILLKVALNTLNQNLNQIEMISFGFYIKSININIISLKHLIDYTIISDYALPILPFITHVISIMILSSTKPVIYYLSCYSGYKPGDIDLSYAFPYHSCTYKFVSLLVFD